MLEECVLDDVFEIKQGSRFTYLEQDSLGMSRAKTWIIHKFFKLLAIHIWFLYAVWRTQVSNQALKT
jgi:membrane protein YdbS with pleckstrin-like domain